MGEGLHHSEPEGVLPFSSLTDQDERVAQDRRKDQDQHMDDERMDRDEQIDQDTRKKGGAGKPKPIPIREAVGDRGPRTTGNSETRGSAPTSQAPGPRGQRERPDGPRRKGASRKREGGRRRRPDRKGAASGRASGRASGSGELPRPPLQRTPLEELPFRSFEHDGCEWIVRLCGQTSTGSAMDPGAPLMHLVFYPAADPSVACGDLLETGRSLDGLPELRLSELLDKVRLAPSANDSS